MLPTPTDELYKEKCFFDLTMYVIPTKITGRHLILIDKDNKRELVKDMYYLLYGVVMILSI